jgi:hypothetical protein
MEAGENQKQVSTAPTTASVLTKTKAKAKPKTHKAAA